MELTYEDCYDIILQLKTSTFIFFTFFHKFFNEFNNVKIAIISFDNPIVSLKKLINHTQFVKTLKNHLYRFSYGWKCSQIGISHVCDCELYFTLLSVVSNAEWNYGKCVLIKISLRGLVASRDHDPWFNPPPHVPQAPLHHQSPYQSHTYYAQALLTQFNAFKD